MRRLLRANFSRWRKSRCMWLGAIAMAAYSMMLCAMSFQMYQKYGTDTTDALVYQLFDGAMVVGVVIAVFCSMFVGTEYSDGTIRNKIIAGHKRWAIYLANFVFCAVSGVVFFLTSVAASGVLGWLLFGPATFPVSVLLTAADGILMCTASAALGNLIGMLITNKSYTAVTNIVVTLVIIFAASYLVSRLSEPAVIEMYDLSEEGELVSETGPNPMYLEETEREVCSLLVDLLPGGQAYQVANFAVERPYRILWCAIGDVIVLNVMGIWFFQRKDLK